MIETTAPESVSQGAYAKLLAEIEKDECPASINPPAQSSSTPPVLPQPLRGYTGNDVDQLNWQRLGLGASQLLIPTSEAGVTARLLRIPAGRPVPTHTHGGLELTLVLSGAFSDSTGRYGRGDLQQADGELEHQPHATSDADCICLAITDAPLSFKSLAARVVQPFLGI